MPLHGYDREMNEVKMLRAMLEDGAVAELTAVVVPVLGAITLMVAYLIA